MRGADEGRDAAAMAAFFDRMESFGLGGRAILISAPEAHSPWTQSVFVGMARMILGVAYGRGAVDAPSLTESLPLVAGAVLLGSLVLMLGLYIPSPLHDTLAEAARALGGGAP